MERIDKRDAEALNWLRFILNPDTTMPAVSDWPALMAFVEKQALIGICLPEECPKNLPKELLLQWIGNVQFIEQQNKLLNKRIEQLFELLERDGFRCCLLKGQGNAAMYPNVLRRCPGDIDVWIDAEENDVFQYVRRQFPDAGETIKHIQFPIFEDVSVDVHTAPLKFYSGRYQKRLQHWIEKNQNEQFVRRVKLDGINREVKIPTTTFNLVYQMGHMFIHTFDEGLGLRQLVDYFYLLKGMEISSDERLNFVDTLKELGMFRFAQAVMWIECEVMGLSVERCLITQDEKYGRRLLGDVLEGGNFGHFSQRYNGNDGFYFKGLAEAWRNITFLSIAPREGIARLIFRFSTAVKHTYAKVVSELHI